MTTDKEFKDWVDQSEIEMREWRDRIARTVRLLTTVDGSLKAGLFIASSPQLKPLTDDLARRISKIVKEWDK